ncbi:MAG: WGR domain-containing protein [Myxococcales bacterium]|nr:WGR domain-containing protein [Myxococcales bacterium]
MSNPKSYKLGDPKAPKFPAKFDILEKAVLQKTDVKANNNKYYAIELHSPATKQKSVFRVFTHYGRTDDLQSNPDAGAKECRYFTNVGAARSCYQSIHRQKTGAGKGYKEVSLASSKIGSKQARGQSVGKIDSETLAKGADAKKGGKKKAAAKTVAKKAVKKLDAPLQHLVDYIYAEATDALQKSVDVTITANGIETPLGILTLGQIEKGQSALDGLQAELMRSRKRKATLAQLSSEFYSAIPHRVGRTRKAIEAAVINDMAKLVNKQDTLQLMRDMLSVSGGGEQAGHNVLYDGSAAEQYAALGCKIAPLAPSSPKFAKWSKHVLDNQTYKGIKIVNLYEVQRPPERKVFKKAISNQKFLFHGSNIRNWVGILSRGILLPKAVVSMGGERTDEGWLGAGIYFSTESSTAAQYTARGRKGTSLMAIARVALGKQARFTEITYGLTAPPKGHHSCYGVSMELDEESEFDDNEHVIYDARQQQLEILVEFK